MSIAYRLVRRQSTAHHDTFIVQRRSLAISGWIDVSNHDTLVGANSFLNSIISPDPIITDTVVREAWV